MRWLSSLASVSGVRMGASESLSYDSTWEDEVEEKTRDGRGNSYGSTSPLEFSQYMSSDAAQDMQNYRRQYPYLKDNSDDSMLNFKFYRNEIPFHPNGLYIEDMLETWKNEYDILESNHNYIQWLFPLREPGLNQKAPPLSRNEIKRMVEDSDVNGRFLAAYKLMLGFYGLTLNEETEEVQRADNWKERYANLNWSSHNYLRITRILKSLGEMGYEIHQRSLIRFFLQETLMHGHLSNLKRSVLDYFIFSVRDKRERQILVHEAWMLYKPQDEFIWGPVTVLQNFHNHDKPSVVTSQNQVPSTSNINPGTTVPATQFCSSCCCI
ncbi:opioid growth factor receptor-like isoform X2 [Hyperolius riggenbachi]|uniref:opioid growth factor receptor-like isoform X2 n=1 Tax=Hyperolius riggenbachi TaxID=752182 RepID=UPI0035A2B0D9